MNKLAKFFFEGASYGSVLNLASPSLKRYILNGSTERTKT